MTSAATATRHGVVAGVVSVLLLGALRGCSSDRAEDLGSPPDASDARDDGPRDAPTAPDVRPDTDTGDGSSKPDVQDPPKPPTVPEGWKFYPDYDPQCTLWYAPSEDLMPPPIAWEPCKNPIGPSGMQCRQMVVDWEEAAPGFPIAAAPQGVARADGSALLQLSRTTNAGLYWLVAEADGPVRQALFGVDQSCILGSNPTDGEHAVWRVFDNQPDKYETYGAIASKLGEFRPRFYRSQIDGGTLVHYPYVPGPYGMLENGHLIYGWDDAELAHSFFQDPEDAGMMPVNHFFAGGALFWAMSAGLTQRLKVWTPQAGVRTFLTRGDDVHSGVAGLCSDGTDMMWALAEERPKKLEPYEKVTLYTAKFTSDPDALEPRRLCSDFPGTIVFEKCEMGCGYAARETYEDLSVGSAGVRVVRLSDGWSWMLTYNTATVDKWMWGNPIAITCDEIFITVKTPSWNIARVRLDSLGPGEPPD